MNRARVALLIALSLIAGCKVRSELVVGMSTDLTATGQLDHITFTALKNGVDSFDYAWDLADVPEGKFELPGSIGLYTDDGSEPRVNLVVRGFLQGAQVVEREAVMSLIHGETLFTRMGLVGDCNSIDGPVCADTEACIEGVCRANAVDAHALPSYYPKLATWNACPSGPHWVISSTGAPMPLHSAACSADEYCREGTCYKASGALPSPNPLWTLEPSPVTSNLHALWGTSDGADVYAVGDTGTILHRSATTPNADDSWLSETSGVTDNLRGVWGGSATDVYAVGRGGSLLHRTAKGWSVETGLTGASWNAVWGTTVDGTDSTDSVWAAGRDVQGAALVAHRSNGSWSAVATAPGQVLRAIGGAAGGTVWAAGSQGTLLGGGDQASFSTATYPGQGPTNDLYAVWGDGTPARSGTWVAGLGGLILHDDGTGWSAVQSPSPNDLLALWGQNGADLYAAGVDGYLIHFDGRQFSPVNVGTGQTLTTVWGTAAGDVFVAGYAGTILHSTGVPVTSDGGTPVDGGVDFGAAPQDLLSSPADLGDLGDFGDLVDLFDQKGPADFSFGGSDLK